MKRSGARWWSSLGVLLCPGISAAHAAGATDGAPKVRPDLDYASRSGTPPRKVVIGSAVASFSGSIDERLEQVAELAARAARASEGEGHRGLDLLVFPEFALGMEEGLPAAQRAVELEGRVGERLGAIARKHRAWMVVPMTLRERDRISNAAVLLNRDGRVAGVFRKVHPMADDQGVFEGGVQPGSEYPVFACDFGRLGILICWDMSYEEAWDRLAAAGAEIVALPSASPQTLRPMAQALRHHYYVVTSTLKDNASLFDPLGRTAAQQASVPGVLVREIDLSFAILHWSENLQGGRLLTERFGDKVGYDYSNREDTGLFWSNDPSRSIGSMIAELGLREMPAEIRRMESARLKAR